MPTFQRPLAQFLAIDLTPTHGGGQQVLLNFLRVLERAGAGAVAMIAAGGWLEGSLDQAQERVSVPAPGRRRGALVCRGLRFVRYCWMLFRQRAVLRNADSIVVNDPEMFLPVALGAGLLRKQATLYLHMAYRGPAAFVLRLAAMMPAVNRLVCVSHFVRRHTEARLPESAREKLVVIENGLPDDLAEPGNDVEPGSVHRIAVVGRLVPDKGQDVVCSLSHRLPESEFHLVGPEEDADRAFVETLRRECAGNVSLVGYRHPVVAYLREMQIGILLVPSRIAEACPLTPIEGAAAGCAVVARNLGGLAEVAGNAGFTLVDDDEQFFRAVRALQAMDAASFRVHINATRRRALAHYHPRRYERDVVAVFGLR